MNKTTFLLILFLAGVHMIFAQNKITGVVRGESGEPIYGAVVKVKGKPVATTTNADGEYSIEAFSSDVLEISSVGMSNREVAVGNQSVIDVSMGDDIQQLGDVEVVSTGYGKVEKAGFTGSASIVGEKQVENVPVASFQKAIQGNIAGVQALGTTGQPGGGLSIRIRGAGSLNASSEPLYVVDGVPIASGTYSQIVSSIINPQTSDVLSSLNPDDIASITILKDASASSIYGARAANGVVLITTKQGKRGEAKINVSADAGISMLPLGRKYELASSGQIHKLYYDAYIKSGKTSDEAAYNTSLILNSNPYNMDNPYNEDGSLKEGAKLLIDTDWIDVMFDVGMYNKYFVNFSGATDKTKYYTSFGYFSQQGIVVGTEFDRISGKINLETDLRNNLKMGINTTFSYSDQKSSTGGGSGASPIRNGLLFNNAVPFYQYERTGNSGDDDYLASALKVDENGNLIPILVDGKMQYNFANPVSSDFNPVYTMENNMYNTKTYKVLIDAFIEWEIVKNLMFRPSISTDYTNLDEFQFYNPYHGNAPSVGGRGYRYGTWNVLWKNTNSISYDKTFDEVHRIDAFGAFEVVENTYRSMFAHATNYPDFGEDNLLPELANASVPQDATSSSSRWSLISIISRLNYSYDHKYYFSATFRRDGSSRFGENNKYGNFWSLGASWNIKKEPFMDNVSYIDNLKLRASYGTSGNDQVGVWDYYSLYSSNFTYNGSPGYVNDQIENPDLSWEQSANFNVGIDFMFLEKFRGSLEFYNKTTSDLLYSVPLQASVGGDLSTTAPSYNVNFGTMRNRGIEFEISYTAVNTEDLHIDLNFNISGNRNKILELPVEESVVGTKIWREGTDMYQFYIRDWAGVAKAGEQIYDAVGNSTVAVGGEALWYRDVEDEQGNVVGKQKTKDYSSATRYEVGSASPDFYGGIGSSITYRGVNLSFLFSYSVGGKILDGIEMHLMNGGNDPYNVSIYQLDHYGNNVNSENSEFKPSNTDNSDGTSTRFLYDASFIRLRNVSLSYSLPKEFVNVVYLKDATFLLTAENLWAHFFDSDFKGYDTEMGGLTGEIGLDIPNPTTVSLGLKLNI